MQSSGTLTGTAPAPDLVNDFALMHELNFSKRLMNRYLLDGETTYVPLYPLEFTQKYGRNTITYINDILTVAPGLPSRKGPTLNKYF